MKSLEYNNKKQKNTWFMGLVIFLLIIIVPAKAYAFSEFSDKNERSISTVSGNWAYEEGNEDSLPFLVYVPDIVNDNTKIILFLHGNGETKSEWYNVFGRYEFVNHLDETTCIFIFPLEKKKSNWGKDIAKLDEMINSVCAYTGAVRENNTYIAGVSAGADAVTDIASKIDFCGAIYMAGSLKGSKKLKAHEVAELWEGKPVYYFRDNMCDGGGYNYDAGYINRLKEYSDEGIFDFYALDLNWEHSHFLVDAVFMSDYRYDLKNQKCHGVLDTLFTDNVQYEYHQSVYQLNELYKYCHDSMNELLTMF